ncbi:hypothetical protein D3C84_1145650 [compost metagenome]
MLNMLRINDSESQVYDFASFTDRSACEKRVALRVFFRIRVEWRTICAALNANYATEERGVVILT